MTGILLLRRYKNVAQSDMICMVWHHPEFIFSMAHLFFFSLHAKILFLKVLTNIFLHIFSSFLAYIFGVEYSKALKEEKWIRSCFETRLQWQQFVTVANLLIVKVYVLVCSFSCSTLGISSPVQTNSKLKKESIWVMLRITSWIHFVYFLITLYFIYILC